MKYPLLLAAVVAGASLAHDPEPANYATTPVAPFDQADKAVYDTIGGMGCAVCHGEYGDGGESMGTNIRHSSLERLLHAFESVPVMQGLARAIDEDSTAALDRYIDQLAQRQLIKWTVTRDGLRLDTDEALSQDVMAQVVVHNGTSRPISGEIAGQPVTIAARGNAAVDIEPGVSSIALSLGDYQDQVTRQ